MGKGLPNFAFIDGTNLHLSAKAVGWGIDWNLFRQYLVKRHNVASAYYFVGYRQENQSLYNTLSRYGYTLIHKPALRLPGGRIKGDCDAEMVLRAMVELENYRQAIIVTGDGDLACLVEYLSTIGKFKLVIACKQDSCSYLLRKAAGGNILFLDTVRDKFEKK